MNLSPSWILKYANWPVRFDTSDWGRERGLFEVVAEARATRFQTEEEALRAARHRGIDLKFTTTEKTNQTKNHED